MVVPTTAPLITVLDHDPAMLRLMEQVLTQAGYRTLLLPDGSDAYYKIKEQRPDLVVLDTWLETRGAGWDVLEIMRLDEETQHIPVLICSSDVDGDEERTLRAAQPGCVEVLTKPFEINLLVSKIRSLLTPPTANSPLPSPLDQFR
jgi:DNA-binding response OmpR family regulator